MVLARQVALAAMAETSIRAAVAVVKGAWVGKEAQEVRQDKPGWVELEVRAGNNELISLALCIARVKRALNPAAPHRACLS